MQRPSKRHHNADLLGWPAVKSVSFRHFMNQVMHCSRSRAFATHELSFSRGLNPFLGNRRVSVVVSF